jgi:carboxyl-terminal processing protease
MQNVFCVLNHLKTKPLVAFVFGCLVAQIFPQLYRNSIADVWANSSKAIPYESDETPGFTDSVFRRLDTLGEILGYIEQYYVEDRNAEQLVVPAIEAVMDKLDPHSLYFTQDAYKEILSRTEGELADIGVKLAIRGQHIAIDRVQPHSPAAQAALRPGDILQSIEDEACKPNTWSAAVVAVDHYESLLQGPVHSSVQFTIRSARSHKLRTLQLKRELPTHEYFLIRQIQPKWGYLRVKSFTRNMSKEIAQQLKAYPDWTHLIIDFRDNPGGLLDEAVALSDLFIQSGTIVSIVGRNHKLIEKRTAEPHTPFGHLRLALLVDNMTASSAEIVAAALQEHQRADIFGQTTYGKGSVQSMIDLSDGSGIKLTVAHYHTPHDHDIDGVGVKPNHTVAMPASLRHDRGLDAILDFWKKEETPAAAKP